MSRRLVPPGTFEDTRFFYFGLSAKIDALRALCDRYLNTPSGGKLAYRPVGVVLLAFSHVERLSSETDPDRGGFTYKDIAFWVPVLGGVTHPVCLFPAFIFVDDAATMATGRELFGLPKQLGRFQMPIHLDQLSGGRPPQFRAEVSGTLQPGGMNDWRTLVTLEYRASREETTGERIRHALHRLLLPEALQRGFDFPAWLSTLSTVPSVGLKQFRDATEPGKACYQAVIEAPLRVQRLMQKPRFFHDAFTLRLEDVASHPVADVLGLSTGEQSVALAVYFGATMRMDVGQVVWRAR